MTRTIRTGLVLLLLTGAAAVLLSARGASARPRPALEIQNGAVRIRAFARPTRFSRLLFQPGHHAVVWEKGRSHYGALFESQASDHDVRVALRTLGAKAGENLSEDTWNARKDEKNPEPDKRVEGTPIDVFVDWRGSGGAIPLSHLILENGRAANFDFRFGGNERFQKNFKSGCIVCDYSCPGGAIGNRNRTIRDEVKLGTIFKVNRKRMPKDGTVVTVILRPR